MIKRALHIARKPVLLIKDNWKDPVWSKVIAAFIIAVLTTVIALLKSIFSGIPFFSVLRTIWVFLVDKTPITNGVILIASTIAVYFIGYKIFRLSSDFRKRNQQEIEVESYPVDPAPDFSNRVAKAFPGLRGIKTISNPKDAIHRLEILLKKPLEHKGVSSIYWYRGSGFNYISSFQRLRKNKVLMNQEELVINKITAYHGRSYFRDFVYVETEAEKQIGINEVSNEVIERCIESFGYAFEEYGLFGKKVIRREEHDDGAATFNGKVIDTTGSVVRTRYLTKYNFLIVPTDSPLLSSAFEELLEDYLNRMLKGEDLLERLVEESNKLPKIPT